MFSVSRTRFASAAQKNTARLSSFFSKIPPRALEWMILLPGLLFAASIIVRTDIMLPGYTNAVTGGNADGSLTKVDPIESYTLEPIRDDDGKVVAMRKIRKKKTDGGDNIA